MLLLGLLVEFKMIPTQCAKPLLYVTSEHYLLLDKQYIIGNKMQIS